MRYLLSCIFLFLGIVCANAQHMYSRQFPFFNQLSSNEIFDMHQDKEGYLWIGTTNGLARYDKYRLLNFRSDYKNPNLLTNNAIINIDDNNLYVWLATWGGVNLYDKNTCQIIPFPDARLQNKLINYIAVDNTETAWVASQRKIYRCDSTAHIVKEYDLNTFSAKNEYDINTIYVDKKNRVWVMSSGGIFGYDAQTDAFIHYPTYEIGSSAYTMYEDKLGNYWLGTWGMGFWQFFPDKKGRECYKQHDIKRTKNGADENIVFSLEQDDAFGYLWLLSYAGLSAFRYTDEGTLENVNIDGLIDTQMMYTRFCKDREGNLWLGSYDMAYTIFFDNSNIDNYPLSQLKKQMGWDANILNICQDNDSIMWFNQDRYQLCLYDLSRDMFAESGLGEVNIIIKSHHKPGVWANSRNSPNIRRLTQRNMKVQIEEDINLGGVTDLTEDKDGNLWISTWANLQVKQPDSKVLIVSDGDVPKMNTLAADMKGEIWGISNDKNIYRLNCTANRISCELKGNVSALMEKEHINSFCIDSKGCLWLNTSLGRILKSDGTKQTFKNISLDNSIDDCTVLGILPDKNNVWIIANKKVLQYDIDSKTYLTYSTAEENIMVDVFRYKAISPDRQGGLYVGGHRGFIHIQPGAIPLASKFYPRIHITDVKVEDKSIFFDEASPENTISNISLKPNDRNIEIFFSPLLYSLNAGYRMAYQLEGVDQNWIYLDHDKSSAFYNHLSKGSYKLRVKMEYEQGKWTEEEVLLTLVKTPAFYETWFAYLVYIVLIGICLYVLIRLYIHRIKRKNDIKLQEELTRTKLTYFTNVSHELLTPLTVISCISDYLDKKSPIVHQQSIMLKANVDKLKRLIQQVLDFRKIDVGKLKLGVSKGNIHEFILNICRINFVPLARQKNITLEAYLDMEEASGYIDFDKLDKIMHNLLSNAIKYTQENKCIYVNAKVINRAEHKILIIKVQDEGIGIPAKEIEDIFTRFYSGRKNRGIESNGIGLSLTKDLINLHHGTITVESVLGQGTCFIVELPIDRNSYSPDELDDEIIDLKIEVGDINLENNVYPDDTDKPAILLIDDNTELLFVMKEIFKERYTVHTAINGQQAWDKLTNNEVDIIVCDVMMPDTNGWELCADIKKDLRFNHLPIIILTAKNGIDDRVASYEAGADGYIAKPFEMKLLFARVDNLIKSSKIRQTAFRKEESINLDSLTYPSGDKKFLQSIIDSIEQHLEEPDFDLEQLSMEMNMSKSTLYRKIKTMTGMTPLEFVRNIKMKRACVTLLAGTQNISEVAYSLGFSSPKYFTKCFKEEFDITPSEYLQKHNDR